MTTLPYLIMIACVIGTSVSRTARNWTPGFMISGEGRLIHKDDPLDWQNYDDDMLAQVFIYCLSFKLAPHLSGILFSKFPAG